MPCRLATAATGSRSASRMIATICSSENRPFRIAPSESEPVSQLIDGPKIPGQVTRSIDGGFYQRWLNHHALSGDAIRLRGREPSDYQVSILEVAGSAMSDDDILKAEQLWIEKRCPDWRGMPP